MASSPGSRSGPRKGPRPSQMELARRRGKLLDYIMQWKRQELPRRMARMPLEDVKALAHVTPPARSLAQALTRDSGISLIAEVKRASPSKGLIARDWDPPLIAETYAKNGAVAISCLTDERFFQGKLGYLTGIRERLRERGLEVPILRKDFLFHEYQIYEARMAGADGVLLIAAILGDRELRRLLERTQELGMEALVEVHTPEEARRALATGARLIGVNNRDLRTFQVDLETTARVRSVLPPDVILVGESGIRDEADVRRMAAMGCHAILVGETFCRLPQARRAAAVRRFVEAGKAQADAPG